MKRTSRRALCLLAFAASVTAAEAPVGKPATWDDALDVATPTPPSPPEFAPRIDPPAAPREALIPFQPDESEPPARQGPPPKAFDRLENALDFIDHQRGVRGAGLPATFYVPGGTPMDDPLRQMIVGEGVGLYDTSLAIILLVDAGRLATARELLDIYTKGEYMPEGTSPMELRAFPNRYNGGAFAPFDEDIHYYFNFTNVHGNWLRWGPQWKFWAVHTGPNAWLANATSRFMIAARAAGWNDTALKPYLTLANRLGRAMMRLQDRETQGGIRYAPQGCYHDPALPDPFEEINAENNISAYAALHLLARATGNPLYAQSADRILAWLRDAEVWRTDGRRQRGLLDPSDGTIGMGVRRENGRWVLEPEHPTDSGGTWTISALTPATIDGIWGPGAAFRMWRSVRSRAGRASNGHAWSAGQPLAGLDYSDAFAADEGLISPEWTAGGLFALKALLAHYDGGPGTSALTPAQRQEMRRDLESMSAFIRQNPNPYAVGPGHGGRRQGDTGFHWTCPPPTVHAMASLYATLYFNGLPDPLAFWQWASQPVARMR